MSFTTWNSTLITQQAAGTALTNTLTPTSLVNPQAKFTMPAQVLPVAGSKIKIRASGRISTAAATPGTLTLAVMFGAIAVFSAATPTLTVSQTNVSWTLSVDLTAYTVGNATAATLYGIAEFTSAAVGGSTLLPLTSPGVGTGFDSTVSSLLDLYGTWSVASASNSIRCDDFELILCN